MKKKAQRRRPSPAAKKAARRTAIGAKEIDGAKDLRRFLDHLPSMLGYWDAEARNRFSNLAYARYFGKTPPEIEGLHIRELLGPELFRKNLAYVSAALEGRQQTFERNITTPDGQVIPTLAHYIPDLVDGEVRGFFVIVTDISHVKELESRNREIEAKLTANSRLSALGEMAAGIAHEINNPLSIIYGNACRLTSLLKKGRLDPDVFTETAKEIEQTSLRIEKIVDGLRVISRDGSQDALERADLGRILQSTLALCEKRFGANGIELTVEEPGDGITVECRPVQVAQILLNLLNNAFDSVMDSGVRWVKIGCSRHGDRVRISVANGGPPIPAANAEKIFQPFFTTKAAGRGTGLGLSVSRSLAESNHGGLVLDQKSPFPRFILTLPVSDEKGI